ncbi:hypothetical protein ACWD7B_27405 [Streptomyces rubiginosohelvolus]
MAGLVARELATLAEAAVKEASAGVTPSGGGLPDRSALTAAIAAARYEGVSRSYAFDDERQQLVGRDAHVYRVEDRSLRYLGPAPEPKS